MTAPTRATTGRTPILISIVIVTRDRPDDLQRALASLASTYDDVEIVVADQLGLPATLEVIARHRVIYQKVDTNCLSIARNRSLPAASGEWLTFLDDDCVASDDYLSALREQLRALPPTVGLAYASVKEIESDRYYSSSFDPRPDELMPEAYDQVPSIGILIRREVFTRLSGFDERLGVGTAFGACEDTDLVLRYLLTGRRAPYLRSVVIRHPAALSAQRFQSPQKAYRYGRGKGALGRKHARWRYGARWFAIIAARTGMTALRPLAGTVIFALSRQRRAYYWSSFRGITAGFFQFRRDSS